MERVGIGVIGTGKLGSEHIRNLAHRIPNAELKAICSLDKKRLAELKEECNVPNTYSSVEEMFKNKELEAVAIVTPTTEHSWQIRLAVERGLHIFAEKPLGVNLEECEAAVKLAEKHKDKVFMLAFQRRFDPSLAHAKKLVDNGAIGKPYMIRCYGQDPVYTVEVAIPYAATSGGLFVDMTVHDIDLAHWFMNSDIKTVYAMGGNYVEKRFAQYNDIDNGCALAKFENGGMAMFHSGRVAAHGYHIEIDIIGTSGMLRVGAEPIKNLCTIFNEHGIVKETPYWFQERFAEAYRLEMQAFIDSVQKREASPVSIYDGFKDTTVAYAMKESWLHNRLITV